ncbi:Hsp20/alpha crystallin family protein [Mangrovicella endophytica]|uniref:Hsp20/alpha crystallin family protein n=1 Tax=Mangrovicella endophytica TaxID=2066697 RepID=UPI000C9E07E6|nr:Hsp20/alpha crystallin family protein [Mangrovicella endophytica]
MADAATQLPVTKSQVDAPSAPPATTGNDWISFRTLRDEMDKVFDMFGFGRSRLSLPKSILDIDLNAPARSIFAGTPAADIREKDAEYEITAELPGLDVKDVEVRLSDGVLTLKGEKKEEKDESRADYHLSERRYGSFVRSFVVPRSVDVDRIEASFSNGVLKLRLPKSEQALAQEKTIEIKAA